MSARKEIENLKREFVSLSTEEERQVFDVKFRTHLASKSDAEKRKFADAFADSAKEDAKRIKNFCNEVTVRMKLEEILNIVSTSYIANEYFHKSKSWFSQKLNGSIKNGIPSEFTESELQTLFFALEDICKKIKNTARLIA
jgi:methionyl-tRNA synthetase